MKFNLFNWLGQRIENATVATIQGTTDSQNSLRDLAYFIAVSHIANSIAKSKFRVYDRGEEVKDAFYYAWNVNPNRNESSSQFLHKVVEKICEGECLVIKRGNELFCADSFAKEQTDAFSETVFTGVLVNGQATNKNYKSKDVFYFKLDNESARDKFNKVFSNYDSVIGQAMKSYKNSNGKKYTYSIDMNQAGSDQFQKEYEDHIKSDLKDYVDAESGVFPSFRGQKLEPEKSDGKKDSNDIVNFRKEVFEMAAQTLKIPTSLMLCNTNNIKDILLVYLTIAIDPIADVISEEITRKYFTFDEWKNGSKVKVDTSSITHTDIINLSNEIYNIVGSGVMNIDDVRERLGLPILDTDVSKTYWLSKNFEPIEQAVKGGDN